MLYILSDVRVVHLYVASLLYIVQLFKQLLSKLINNQLRIAPQFLL